ncbi:pancreatic lipase-related protein 2-like [Harmonia axyridis]|uniref:pancreatic lipase-related protein 2-like n=1 Tax=Harmonia axyridis TaxID=115357 RepID=UPI001E27827D|nr:pancreatic lipase-related protein 2-like [Harmonia axyridis]
MAVSDFLLYCFISALPGPPGVSVDNAYVQLIPINKHKCPKIDPVRDISFQLYTRHNPLHHQRLIIGDDEALQKSNFNFSQPTVIFFHAFFENSMSLTATIIRTAYLQRGDHNIILLNAPRLEAGPWYLTAARNTEVVGRYTAMFIDYLVSRGMYLPSLHLVGLSLGAQMAGVCGQNVRSGRVTRITGLDPAGPLFKKWPKNLKLDAGDAEFVDVIHTDAGIFGYPTQIGHVDFWPNRGISPQPGCTIPEVKRRNPDAIIEPLFCSHWRSYQFYAESVLNPYGFLSVACNSWEDYTQQKCDPNQVTNMGFAVDYNARGNYYLRTNRESPFSIDTSARPEYSSYFNKR